MKAGTELGKKVGGVLHVFNWIQAKGFMDSGAWAAFRWLSRSVTRLVPSELIVDLVKDRLQQQDVKDKGCLLDGFPRAPDQVAPFSH